MSYHYYLQSMHQLMGMYGVPISKVPLLPAFLPTPIIPPINQLRIERTTVGCENEVDRKTIFCANLHGDITEELLYEVFLQAGPIQKVHIPKDNTGKSRSFGFVTYKYHCSAVYALRLYKGLALFGVRLDVKLHED